MYEQAVTALLRLNRSAYPVVVVTNQSAVGRGLVSMEAILEINRRVLEAFEVRGVQFAGSYLCPHASEEGCDCRKPQPGMLVTAARELNLDLSQSYMIGDAVTDIEAGEAVGAKTILVRTGRGNKQSQHLGRRPACPVVKDLTEAVGVILGDAS